MQRNVGDVSLGRALLGPFTTLSLGAAAIHFAVTPAHFQQWPPFGVFMASVGWLQALWAIAYVLRPSPRLALSGAVMNLAIAAVWAVSRSAGVPIGPGAGMPEAVGIPDIAATSFELLLVAGLSLGLLRPLRRAATLQRVTGTTSRTWSMVAAIVVAVATSAAITVGLGSMP